jgi:hypothetical protein
MWKPIENQKDLPQIGTLESSTLDFKGAAPDDTIEMAKDVAAFANAQGGTLLIGAHGGSQLQTYKPMAAGEAKRVAVAFDEAVKVRCAPSPLFSTELISYESGFIVAINVQPFPGQVVGVGLTKAESQIPTPKSGKTTKGVDGLFSFPLRVGTHTKVITPEQLPMFMDAKIRRVAIALEAIVGKRVVLFDFTNTDKRVGLEVATVERVDMITNVLELMVDYESDHLPVQLPLDFVETVCQAKPAWHLYLNGHLDRNEWQPNTPEELRPLKFIFRASR